MKSFESRKNNVSMQNESSVIKTFSNASAWRAERDILILLNGRAAPKLISEKNERALVLEYVEGQLLLDAYVGADEDSAGKLAASLAATVSKLYNLLGGRITFDENFRNYIVAPAGVIRIDFEETTVGGIDEWCAKLCAFAALYGVADNVKINFMLTLCRALEIPAKCAADKTETELKALSARWQTAFPGGLFENFKRLLCGKWVLQSER